MNAGGERVLLAHTPHVAAEIPAADLAAENKDLRKHRPKHDNDARRKELGHDGVVEVLPSIKRIARREIFRILYPCG